MKIKTAIILFLFVPLLVFAKNQAALPSAGLTPESPFYFFDKLGETLQEFFTFNPEGKARLQITFAAERVAEIKVILETKGVDAKGLEVAQARLQEHLGDAAEIVIKQKGKGKDVSKLAKELADGFEEPKSKLADSFKSQKQALGIKEGELKTQLKAAHSAGDTAKEEALVQKLGQVKAQKELLELKKDDIEDELGAEEEKLEEEMEARHKAEKAIREAEEEKAERVDEAAEEGVELPANAFAEFDSLLAQAKSALQAGNFAEAKNFAKRAEKSLNQIAKTIKELEKNQEKKEEAEEAIQEAEEGKQEVLDAAKKEKGKQGKIIEKQGEVAGKKQRDVEKKSEELENTESPTNLHKQFSVLKDELLSSKTSGMVLAEEHYQRILRDLDKLQLGGYPKDSIDELRRIALDLVPYLKDKKPEATPPPEVKTPIKQQDKIVLERQPSAVEEAPKTTPSIPVTSPNPEAKLVLKNLIVEIEPYDKSLGRAGGIIFELGDTLPFATFGEVVQGPDGAKTLPTFEYHTVPSAEVFAAAEGVVVNVHSNSGWNDYEILITPDADSYWQVWYDHVQNVSVKKGDHVTAGQGLGTSGIRSQTAGRTELMVRYSNWRTGETYTVCPFSVFDPSLSSIYQNKISQLMQDWEDFKGDSTIYSQSSHIYPGCQQEKIEE